MENQKKMNGLGGTKRKEGKHGNDNVTEPEKPTRKTTAVVAEQKKIKKPSKWYQNVVTFGNNLRKTQFKILNWKQTKLQFENNRKSIHLYLENCILLGVTVFINCSLYFAL